MESSRRGVLASPGWKGYALSVALALLVVLAQPAAASHTAVISIHTTDSDFNNAETLDAVVVWGAGDSARVRLGGQQTGTTASLNEGSFSDTGNTQAWGITVQPNQFLTGVKVELVSGMASTADTVQIINSTDDVIASESISGDTVTIDVNLSSGQNYAIIPQADTGDPDLWRHDSASFPESSGDIDIVGDSTGSTSTGGTDAYNIHNVTGVTPEGPGTYVGANHSASNVANGFTNITVTNASATVTWQAWDGSSWVDKDTTTYTTDGNKSVSLSGSESKWRVNVTFENATGSGDPEASLYDEGVEADTAAPSFDNASASPSGGTKVTSDPVTLSIDVNDSDFATVQGDTVTVEFFVNGTSEGTDTLTSNGTATLDVSPDLGTVEWWANATDSYGHEQESQKFLFETPSQLQFRNETNASQIVTGTSATVTFYGTQTTTVIQKTDSDNDGNISLAGLPSEPMVVTVDVTGWYDRRIYIDSIYDQANIYLLNSTAFPDSEAVLTTFEYEDRTGDFPPDNTVLMVQRAVDKNGDGNHSWETMAGDFWGAAGEFPFTGQYQSRYRLIIENTNTSETRDLGTHIPTSDGTKQIIVGKLNWPALNETGRWFSANISDGQILTTYHDPNENSTDIRIRVWELGNTSNEIFGQNYTSGPYGTLRVSVDLTDNQTTNSWVVNYTATTDTDGDVSGQVLIGGDDLPLPVDSWLLGTMGLVFVTFVASLYGPRTAQLGAWVIVGTTGVLMMFQWVNVPLAGFIAAGLIATGGTLYREALP